MSTSIFNKSSFSLRDLCFLFLQKIKKMCTSYQFTNSNEYKNIKYICHCYLLFTNNDKKYLQYLNWTRINCCPIYINNKQVNLRHVLQQFDDEFNKLVIRIRTGKNSNNIIVSWDEYNKKYPNFDKSELYNLLEKYDTKLSSCIINNDNDNYNDINNDNHNDIYKNINNDSIKINYYNEVKYKKIK